jgi:O-antigen/teichoic acid export membrane protein
MQSAAAWKARLARSIHVPDALKRQLGWTTGGYAFGQVVRFGSNLILTRLLAPDLFGLMILLTSIRIGIELFTDIGIGQNVIASPHTRNPRFYNTAWTLQVTRGLLLGGVLLALLPVLRQMYPQPSLQQVLPVLSLFLIVSGAHSIGPTVAVKELRTKRIAIFEAVSAVIGAALIIGAVVVSPTIWGLLVGQLLGALVTTVASYFVLPDIVCRPAFDRKFAGEIISFGKWIFISSIVYFLSTYLDRLILGNYVSLALLGVYGIARSLGDVFSQFGTRLGNAIIFPKIASTEHRGPVLAARLARPRGQFLIAFLGAIALFIALSEPLIRILYDARYHGAAQLLPWVGLAAWLTIVNTANDSMLLGLSKPQMSAAGNFAKLLGLVILLPWMVSHAGIAGAAVATVASELVRYAVLLFGQRRERVSFVRQDVLATAALIAIAFALHAVMHALLPTIFAEPLFQLSWN